jgi:putative nucleotidyltransferase with HDIG domain
MKRKAEKFIFWVSLTGMIIAVLFIGRFFRQFALTDLWDDLLKLACAVFLCTVTRACPIYMRRNQALDVSVIAILAVYLTRGVDTAILTWFASSIVLHAFDLITAPDKFASRTGTMKFFFNTSNVIIAILLSSMACELLPWEVGDMSFPFVLLPTIMFSMGAFTINALIMLTMFWLNGEISGKDIIRTMSGLIRNVVATMPLGLLIAELLVLESGTWLALIMLFPLLLARYAWRLYIDSQNQQGRLISAFVSTMEAKDTYTQGHSARVSGYAEMIAREMHLNSKQLSLMQEAALLHDIGKIGIDDYILRKPGPLNDQERKKMQQHPLIGVKIVEQVGLLPEVIEMIRDHHERIDGKGYPNGITGDKMALGARILGVADAYDAMTSDRPYRSGMPQKRAIEILREESGKQFDAEVVRALISALEAADKPFRLNVIRARASAVEEDA